MSGGEGPAGAGESPDRDALADQPLAFAIERRERLCEGFRPFEAVILRHAPLSGEGAMIGPLRREFVATGSVVVVIPYDPARDRIVLVRQFRLGAALKTPNAAALELPAGLVDEGEAPDAAAGRELLEETGLEARALVKLFTMLPSPGLTDEIAFVYLALVDAAGLSSSAGLAEESEDIRPVAANVEALVAAVDGGSIVNGFLIACTHWFARRGRAAAAALAANEGAGAP